MAVVVATDRYKAQDALEFIEVDYEPMDVVTDLEEAVAEGSPLAHEDFGTNEAYTWDLATGDIDEAFSKADVTVKGRYLQPRLIPNAIETRGVVANPDPSAAGSRSTPRHRYRTSPKPCSLLTAGYRSSGCG